MSYIIKQVENDEAILKIVQDDDAFNPREEFDNAGHMICWHRRYNLGDNHNFDSPESFLISLIEDIGSLEEKLQPYFVREYGSYSVQQDDDGWVICSGKDRIGHYRGYETEEEAEEDFEEIKNAFIEEEWKDLLSVNDLMDIISDSIVMLPLYLYDHSGITMNTTGFSCRWDSGQVGWIYMTNDEIEKEYGTLDKERAESLLKAEVETYDQYLTGDVYGFTLEKKVKCDCCENVELEYVDSCWGFYGLDYIIEELSSHIDSEYADLVEELKGA